MKVTFRWKCHYHVDVGPCMIKNCDNGVYKQGICLQHYRFITGKKY